MDSFHGPTPSSDTDFFFFLSARGYRCPLCMHSALDMTRYWRQLDDEVAQTPMPTEYQNMMVEVRDETCADVSVLGRSVPLRYWQ